LFWRRALLLLLLLLLDVAVDFHDVVDDLVPGPEGPLPARQADEVGGGPSVPEDSAVAIAAVEDDAASVVRHDEVGVADPLDPLVDGAVSASSSAASAACAA
jgi:hypothetical protein